MLLLYRKRNRIVLEFGSYLMELIWNCNFMILALTSLIPPGKYYNLGKNYSQFYDNILLRNAVLSITNCIVMITVR